MIKATPYRKFILLSSPRSGTHMLRTALRNHPNIAARTELFNPDFLKDKAYDRHTPEKTILNDYVFRSYPRDIKCVGFIIHRSGTPWGDWPDLWEMLQADKSIYVISLRRRNLLRRYLSYQTMRTFRGSPPKPLTFDPVILEQDFEHQAQEIEQFDRNFAGHPLLKIYYEDLCVDYHPNLRKVQKFLRVQPQKIWTDMEGKPIRKLSEAIANYSELNDYFADTKWADFFKDNEQVIHVAKPPPQKKKKLSNYYSKLRSLMTNLSKEEK